MPTILSGVAVERAHGDVERAFVVGDARLGALASGARPSSGSRCRNSTIAGACCQISSFSLPSSTIGLVAGIGDGLDRGDDRAPLVGRGECGGE